MIIFAEIKDGICVRKFWAEPESVIGQPTVVEAESYMVEGQDVTTSQLAWNGVVEAAATEAARLAAIDALMAGDATIAALKAMDNAAFDAWWAANVTTLAQANAVLKRMARLAIRRLA